MNDIKVNEDDVEHGKAMLEKIYGPGLDQHSECYSSSPFIYETLTHLIGKVWDRPHLSIKDRRLLTIGITSMIGRKDLLETQIRGALINEELTKEELEEMVIHISYYAGWGNGTAAWSALQNALNRTI